jgi:hypothetical protein
VVRFLYEALNCERSHNKSYLWLPS